MGSVESDVEPSDFDIDPILYRTLLNQREMDDKGIPCKRVSSDHHINEYGNRLIEFCQCHALYICNGRIGRDCNEGSFTTVKRSIVDYVIGSTGVLTNMNEFAISNFDSMFSDIHRPILCNLRISLDISTNSNKNISYHPKLDSSEVCNASHDRKIVWDKTKADVFKAEVQLAILENPIPEINRVTSVNSACEDLKNMLLKAANNTFKSFCITCKTKKPKTSTKTAIPKPWFDDSCKESRKKYKSAKNRYKHTKTTADLVSMRNSSRVYKRCIRRSVVKHRRTEANRIRNLKTTDPKEYWKILNGNKSKADVKVSLDDLMEHFKNLNKDNNEPDNTLGNSINSDINVLLDKEITNEEILTVVKNLKNNKACGLDNINNEYIKSTIDVLLPVYVNLFNSILDSGEIPNDWLLGKIIPIFKNNGSPNDPANYRGITLLSCLGKLFTSIINNRLCEVVHINKNQAGFRQHHSTLDHIFTLKSLIDIYFKKQKKMFCAFIDYSKAFDSVWRPGLWYKLIKSGITGKMYTLIYNMYQDIRSCVTVNGECSQFFNSYIGVRQGENLSPMLFSIFVNDLEEYLIENDCEQLSFNDVEIANFLKITVLLYADDTIVFADSAKGLQKALNSLNQYCEEWKLTVNEKKKSYDF